MTDTARDVLELEKVTERMLALDETQFDLLADLAAERARVAERLAGCRDLDGGQAERIRRAMERGEIVTGKILGWREAWRATFAEYDQKMRLAGELGHTIEHAAGRFEISG